MVNAALPIVLQTLTLLGGLLVCYVALRDRLMRIETQLEPLWKEFTERRQAARRHEDRE